MRVRIGGADGDGADDRRYKTVSQENGGVEG